MSVTEWLRLPEVEECETVWVPMPDETAARWAPLRAETAWVPAPCSTASCDAPVPERVCETAWVPVPSSSTLAVEGAAAPTQPTAGAFAPNGVIAHDGPV